MFAIDHGIAQALVDQAVPQPCRRAPARSGAAADRPRAVEEVRAGRRLVIFPEGRITVTGSLMKIYDGAALIAEKCGALVTPVRLDGPERTPFSRLDPAQIGRRLFPKMTVTILPPRRLASRPALDGRARRRAAGAALYDIMSDLIFETTDIRLTLHDAFEQRPRRAACPRRGRRTRWAAR